MGNPLGTYCNRIVLVANSRDRELISHIKDARPRDVLVLSRSSRSGARGEDACYHAPYDTSAGVWKSNADAAVLMGTSALALRQRRYVQAFRHIAVGSLSGWLCAIPGLIYFLVRGELKFAGVASYRRDAWARLPLLVFESRFKTKWQSSARLFAPPDKSPLEVLQSLTGIDYAVLRWADRIERGDAISDLDILVADADVAKLQELLSRSLGLLAVDVRSQSGSRGHSGVPYFPPAIARRLLASTVVRASGIKTLSDEAAYLASAYHLLFRKTAGTPAGSEQLAASTWQESRHYNELVRLARACGRREPQTFSDIEADLKSAGMFPPLDTIGIYSTRAPFLASRYTSAATMRPGLSVFLLRETNAGHHAVPQIRQRLTDAGLSIVKEGPIDPNTHGQAIDTIRGGNWTDKHARKSHAPPIHYFVCHNSRPLRPSWSTRRRRPRLDDAKLLVKDTIREALGSSPQIPAASLLHSSDNSSEALEYIRVLGLAEEPVVIAAMDSVGKEQHVQARSTSTLRASVPAPTMWPRKAEM